MPLEFIYLNSPPVVAVTFDNQKDMGKQKCHKVKFEKSTKNNSIEFRKQEKQNKKQKNKQKRQNGNQILHQQIAKI